MGHLAASHEQRATGDDMELILFNIFTSHQADGTEGTFSTFMDGNRLETMTSISVWQRW